MSVRLLGSLFWRDLAAVATTSRLSAGLRAHAETALKNRLAELRMGDRIALARIATPPVLEGLLADPDPKVSRACLCNSRLRTEDLLRALRADTVPRSLIEEAAASSRWGGEYAIRLALVLQPRSPLSVALSQLSSLLKADLVRIAHSANLAPLVQAAALRLVREPRSPGGKGGS